MLSISFLHSNQTIEFHLPKVIDEIMKHAHTNCQSRNNSLKEKDLKQIATNTLCISAEV